MDDKSQKPISYENFYKAMKFQADRITIIEKSLKEIVVILKKLTK